MVALVVVVILALALVEEFRDKAMLVVQELHQVQVLEKPVVVVGVLVVLEQMPHLLKQETEVQDYHIQLLVI
jgi:hypothetical protein